MASESQQLVFDVLKEQVESLNEELHNHLRDCGISYTVMYTDNGVRLELNIRTE